MDTPFLDSVILINLRRSSSTIGSIVKTVIALGMKNDKNADTDTRYKKMIEIGV